MLACRYKAERYKCGLKPSKKGATYAFCTICNGDVCVAGGGKNDVDCHLRTAKHVNLLSQMQSQPSSSSFIAESHAKSIEDQAMRAEIYFAKFVAEHNSPLLLTISHA